MTSLPSGPLLEAVHIDFRRDRHTIEIQTMKLDYYTETDSLYIDLSERPSVESVEITQGVVLDYDAEGNLVGIDIDNASQKVDLHKLTLNKLPAVIQTNPD